MDKLEKKILIHAVYEESLKLERISVFLFLLEGHLKEKIDWEDAGMQKLKSCLKEIKKEVKTALKTSERLIEITDRIKDNC